MRTRRRSYQNGNVERRKRANGPDVWLYRWWERTPSGQSVRRGVLIGTVEEYKTKSEAEAAAGYRRLNANADSPHAGPVTFGMVVDKYIAEEMPDRISTRTFYLPWLKNHIRPKWGEYTLTKIKPLAVREWLRSLPLKKKSKQHIRSLMKLVFSSAILWDLVTDNPIDHVRVTARADENPSEKRVLTAAEFQSLLALMPEPYRTMCIIACCLGLRVSEILGLQHGDIDWDNLEIKIERAVVLGVIGRVKTKKSKSRMPLDPDLANLLLNYKLSTKPDCIPSDWLFDNSETGRPWRPSHIQQKYIRAAGIAIGAGDGIGWHTFRHTFSTLLRANGADIKVQQELLRHADIRTTLDIYTQAVTEQKREAASKVVRMVLPKREPA